MARINVNPTRMELTRLKRRLKTAERGHKLLKDKRDEMMRRFVLLVRENARLRAEVEDALSKALSEFALTSGVMQPAMLEAAVLYPARTAALTVGRNNIMSVEVPSITVDLESLKEAQLSYGFAETSPALDGAIAGLAAVLPDMIRLAEIEKVCNLLADEIEKTRRRVNALEYVMIPDLNETIRYITMKLDENERGALTRLMKVKEMIQAR
ncbi:V-type ATP synthase subunit D [Bacillota bacterium Meth-B3]|nr:V-type ATP synthase subunit D [Christensenellaceae bacterium]MEA5069166.1 V-type ATP synthase subunit D [Christensenellaceae bacterium]